MKNHSFSKTTGSMKRAFLRELKSPLEGISRFCFTDLYPSDCTYIVYPSSVGNIIIYLPVSGSITFRSVVYPLSVGRRNVKEVIIRRIDRITHIYRLRPHTRITYR